VIDRAAPYVLAAGESRRDDAILPFKALANDTGGLLSACEFTLGPWESGPVLHRHTEVDEVFYVVAGKLEAQLDDQRVQAAAGGFLWVPRGTAHSFANAGPEPVQVLALALPGGGRGVVRRAGGLPVLGPGAARSQRARRDRHPSRRSHRGATHPLQGRPKRWSGCDAGQSTGGLTLTAPRAGPGPRQEAGPEPALGDGDHDLDDARPRPVATPVAPGQPIAVGGGPSL
jgi:mannose-6-phosphate isomerase-like protein (cupin superfamily)